MAFLGSTEPRTALPRQAIITDACLALVAVLAALAALEFSPLAAKVAAVLTTAPLAARRLAPLAAFWAILIGVITPGSDNTIVSIAASTATSARQASRMIACRGSAVRGSVLPRNAIDRRRQLRTLT